MTRPQFRDETCAACGHEQSDHYAREGYCHECPSERRCQRYVQLPDELPPRSVEVTVLPEPQELPPKPVVAIELARKPEPEPTPEPELVSRFWQWLWR